MKNYNMILIEKLQKYQIWRSMGKQFHTSKTLKPKKLKAIEDRSDNNKSI